MPQFEKGHQKYGGRKKDTPNKSKEPEQLLVDKKDTLDKSKGSEQLIVDKKDTLNKSKAIRHRLAEFVLENFQSYIDAMTKLRKLDQAAYVRAYNDAVKHVLPTLQSIEMTTHNESRDSLADRINNLAIDAGAEPEQKE